MEYREPLPDNCPPHDAEEITDSMVVLRLVRKNPPTAKDFRSWQAIRPNMIYDDKCKARGLSVYSGKIGMEAMKKLHISKKFMVCHVTLKSGAGFISPANQEQHHTWWPLAKFDVLANCKII